MNLCSFHDFKCSKFRNQWCRGAVTATDESKLRVITRTGPEEAHLDGKVERSSLPLCPLNVTNSTLDSEYLMGTYIKDQRNLRDSHGSSLKENFKKLGKGLM
jgi:hypothetical protein